MINPYLTELIDGDRVKIIFQACAEVTSRIGCIASPDGHLVGSLSELHAIKILTFTLAPHST